jgi:hypothetical protein
MNRDDGPGAVFVIRLPIRHEDQATRSVAPAPPLPGVASAPLDGVRVLLLDRDLEARDLLSVVLEQRGATVRSAASIDQALEMLEAWRPDVLVSDGPGRDTYALVGKVRSLEADRGGRIPALALTTLARTDEGMRLLSDVKRDVPKSVEPAVLADEIARLTGRERRRVQRA